MRQWKDEKGSDTLPGYFQLFLVFLKIGAFTFGGGLAMIPIIKREIVSRGWISEEELTDYIAVSQTAPGMIAINIATLVGTHLKKWKGAMVAVFGVVLPSLVIITLIAMFLREVIDIPLVASALKGITLVVIILLAFAIFDIGKKAIKNVYLLIYALISFSMVFFFNIPTTLVLLLSFLLGTIQAWILSRRKVAK